MFILYIQVPADISEIFLKIKVTSPQKIGDGIGAYLAYNVETRTNMLIFKKRHFNVLRRFSDFLGLHDKLTEKYLRNGRIIPPAPEKSVIGKNTIYFYNLFINLKEQKLHKLYHKVQQKLKCLVTKIKSKIRVPLNLLNDAEQHLRDI
jgi:hypothetical protein